MVSTAAALLLAVRDTRAVLSDDAAITLRYAWRIAHGFGFTYNDGDATNGASAPLYTLLLAGLARIGVDLEVAAKALGAVCYAIGAGLVSWLGARLAGTVAAVLAPTFLVLNLQYRQLALTGMESALAVVLGLGALCLLAADRQLLAGICLGLAVVNKLDAGALALAIALALLTVERRFPTRLAVAATVTALPWLAFSTWYFGSPIPYSAVQKATVVKNAAHVHDPFWMLDRIVINYAGVLFVAACASVVLLPRIATRDRRAAATLLASLAWALFHLVAFSAIDLGDPYPWYLTVLLPPLCLGAAVLGAHALGPEPIIARLRRPVLQAVGVAVLLLVTFAQLPTTARTLAQGHRADASERFEATRRRAGAMVAAWIEPGAVLQTCFGWPAYASPTSPIDETCPLSTRSDVGPPTWGVFAEFPTTGDLVLPPGSTVVATVSSTDDPSGQSIVVHFDRAPVADP